MHVEVAGAGTKGGLCVGLVDDIELAHCMVLTFLLVFDLGSSSRAHGSPRPYSILCLWERFALGCIKYCCRLLCLQTSLRLMIGAFEGASGGIVLGIACEAMCVAVIQINSSNSCIRDSWRSNNKLRNDIVGRG